MAASEEGVHLGSLPPGDADPDLIYVAVGKSIHRWEGLESAFAKLYLKFVGLSDFPDNHLAYGSKNGIFTERMRAICAAAEIYFVKSPDQQKEGALIALVQRAQNLSGERHRIAHGHITQVGAFKPKGPADERGRVVMTATFLYRWAPPFYGLEKLRTNFVGINSATIEAISLQFEDLHNQVHAFTEAL